MSQERLVARLGKLDSCAVSDALDRLSLHGVALGIRPLSVQTRIAGRVVTVELAPADGRASLRHLGTMAIEATQPGDVIVIAHHGREDVAGWGGILSTAAQVKGVAGVVVDGACRDVDESRELGFPVFGRAAVPLTARGRVIETGFNTPIAIGDVMVQPGDLVLADGSGVVFIPAEQAETVLSAAEAIAAREVEMARAVRAGRSVVEVMGDSYESMLKRDA
jgi:4-hydroxy-4-methyl-2-oxoglutarate aldolase